MMDLRDLKNSINRSSSVLKFNILNLTGILLKVNKIQLKITKQPTCNSLVKQCKIHIYVLWNYEQSKNSKRCENVKRKNDSGDWGEVADRPLTIFFH